MAKFEVCKNEVEILKTEPDKALNKIYLQLYQHPKNKSMTMTAAMIASTGSSGNDVIILSTIDTLKLSDEEKKLVEAVISRLDIFRDCSEELPKLLTLDEYNLVKIKSGGS